MTFHLLGLNHRKKLRFSLLLLKLTMLLVWKDFMPRKQTPMPAPLRTVYVAILLPVGGCVYMYVWMCMCVYARVNVCVCVCVLR